MTHEQYREWWKYLKLKQGKLEKELRQVTSDLEALANEMGWHKVSVGWLKGEVKEVDEQKMSQKIREMMGV